MAEVTRYKWGDPIGEFNDTPIYGGDCWSRMPAVYITGTESTNERYSETEEEWELFGAHLPKEVTVMRDIGIGCDNFQALIAAGVAVQDCLHCPLRQTAD
jgi:hypothetical protein